MARSRTRRVLVRRVDGGVSRRSPDELIVEEPLEIRVDGRVVTTTMRTPGHDHDLAVGFAHAEGILAGARLDGVRSCGLGLDERAAFNVVDIATGSTATVTPRLTPTSSACGACGADDIAALSARLEPVVGAPVFEVSRLVSVAEAIRPSQVLFAATGGVHAAAAFDPDGGIEVVREDVGRHNAVDKVVGHLRLADALPATHLALFSSGRAGFDIVQKAWAAGFGTVVAVGAPTSLAVELARTAGITLGAFLRPGGLNVYSEPSAG